MSASIAGVSRMSVAAGADKPAPTRMSQVLGMAVLPDTSSTLAAADIACIATEQPIPNKVGQPPFASARWHSGISRHLHLLPQYLWYAGLRLIRLADLHEASLLQLRSACRETSHPHLCEVIANTLTASYRTAATTLTQPCWRPPCSLPLQQTIHPWS